MLKLLNIHKVFKRKQKHNYVFIKIRTASKI